MKNNNFGKDFAIETMIPGFPLWLAQWPLIQQASVVASGHSRLKLYKIDVSNSKTSTTFP